jgi:hypothetical protein
MMSKSENDHERITRLYSTISGTDSINYFNMQLVNNVRVTSNIFFEIIGLTGKCSLLLDKELYVL